MTRRQARWAGRGLWVNGAP